MRSYSFADTQSTSFDRVRIFYLHRPGDQVVCQLSDELFYSLVQKARNPNNLLARALLFMLLHAISITCMLSEEVWEEPFLWDLIKVQRIYTMNGVSNINNIKELLQESEL